MLPKCCRPNRGEIGATRASTRRRRVALPALATFGAVLLALSGLSGCGRRQHLHPAFEVDQEAIKKATIRGKQLMRERRDPLEAFTRCTNGNSIRVSTDVVVRQAACCYPAFEICYEIARSGDSSDLGIQRLLKETLPRVGRELRFFVYIQVPESRDPTNVQFALRTDRRQEYPPAVVFTPALVRRVTSGLDPNMPPSALYCYQVVFLLRGAPGYTPIGPLTRSLYLVVQDGPSEAQIEFPLPTSAWPGRA